MMQLPSRAGVCGRPEGARTLVPIDAPGTGWALGYHEPWQARTATGTHRPFQIDRSGWPGRSGGRSRAVAFSRLAPGRSKNSQKTSREATRASLGPRIVQTGHESGSRAWRWIRPPTAPASSNSGPAGDLEQAPIAGWGV